MITHLKVVALLGILFTTISGTSAFAQLEQPVMVSTDKDSYSGGETIVVTGEVRDLLSGFQVSLQVFEPRFNNVVSLEQLEVGSDKTFQTEIATGGPLWKSEGTYKIVVVYGGQSRQSETTFEFNPSGVMPTGPTIKVEGTDFNVSYKITGGTVKSITPDVDASSLIIAIDATNDGALTITLPRELIDSLMPNGDDDEFFVLVDGEEVDFDESRTSTERTLTISFIAGSEEIEIIGTHVVPEFGTIAAIILAVAIISIIAVTSRTKLTLMPKY